MDENDIATANTFAHCSLQLFFVSHNFWCLLTLGPGCPAQLWWFADALWHLRVNCFCSEYDQQLSGHIFVADDVKAILGVEWNIDVDPVPVPQLASVVPSATHITRAVSFDILTACNIALCLYLAPCCAFSFCLTLQPGLSPIVSTKCMVWLAVMLWFSLDLSLLAKFNLSLNATYH